MTNTGNADSQEGDTLNIQLWGPANMSDMFAGEEGRLYSEQIALKAGETKEREVLVGITAEMMKEFGFVTARVDAERQVAQEVGDDTFYNTKYLSNLQYADFDLLIPMNMSLEEINVAVDERAKINFNMDLGDLFRNGDTVTDHVANPTVAAVENGVVIGVNKGTTTLYATHAATGAVVSANVNVTGERKVPDIEVLPTALEMIVGGTDSIDYTSPHEGRVTFASSNTGVAAVDANGSVKAIGVGKADITVMLKSDDGKTYTAVCSVTVTKEPSAEPPAPEKQEPSPAAKEDPKPSNTPATPAKVGDIITDASGSTSKGSDTSFVVTKAAMGSVPGEVTYKKEGKNSTTAAIVIPDTIKDAAGKEYKVTRIGEFAFAGNTKVKKVTVGKNVTAIDNGAFQNTTNLQSVILGESVETIGTQAFAGSKKLKTVKAKGSKIKTIKKGAFKACPVLKTVDLSASKVTKIEKQAFSGDKKLKTVKINANKLKSIGANAFAGATKKTKFIIFAKNKKIFNKWVKRLKKVGAKKSKFSFKKKK